MRLPNQTMVPFLAGLLLAGTSAFVAEEMRKRGIEDLIPSHGNLPVSYTHLTLPTTPYV